LESRSHLILFSKIHISQKADVLNWFNDAIISSTPVLVCGVVRLTLATTWPQSLFGVEDSHEVAAQVNGGVREWQECQA